MAEACAVCESPTARSFHFGTKSCKACAAFFRRAVALNVSYICKGGKVCLIHHERRYMCKSCRYDKCFQQGMQKDLVQSKGKLCEREKMEGTSSTPPTPTFDVSTVPSCSKGSFQVVNFYAKLEAALNDRRKVMYTNLKLKDILSDSLAEIPFTKDCLKIFDYRSWRGLERKDFTMLFDYVRSMPQFGDLCKEEQGILYRYTVVVDALLGGSYLSSRLTYEEKWLIMVDCTYYPMNPAPLTGKEPDAHMHFQTREDFEKYKSLVVPMAENWTSLVEPMHSLNPSFHEYALLKALVCWHICHYKFQPQGKTICANQRNAILQAFFTLYDRDDEAAVLRLGEFLLFISNIFERVYDLVTSLYMVTFFEIVDADPFTVDLLDQNAL